MIIKWVGHASFRIELNDGRSVVTDPYDEKVGYALPVHKADIVTISHEHFDHNYIGNLSPVHVLREAGKQELGGITIEGFPSFHDDEQGAKRGKNMIYLIEADGMRVLHLGDLGHDLSDEQIAAFGPIDVLTIPVGGVFTIDAEQAAALAKRINARIIVPMHFKTASLSFGLGENTLFVEAMGGAKESHSLDPASETAACVVLMPGEGL